MDESDLMAPLSMPLVNKESPLIVIVAGEPSGDSLAARLMMSLRELIPNARFAGIAGPKMIAAGCEAWHRAEELAVMGLFEVLPELPRLLRIRRQLVERVLREQPAVYIGVDFKEFNLSIEKRLKQAGIHTVQYVSPQIWAWRQGRVRKIGLSVDLMLCLMPFEKPFYDRYNVDARFVGHPLADDIPLQMDCMTARQSLDIPSDARCIALLPGSRRAEVVSLASDFAATVAWFKNRQPDVRFVAPMASPEARELFEQALCTEAVLDRVHIVDGQSQTVLAAADAALVASGTATLETALCKKPMVAVYRLGVLTSFLLLQLKLAKVAFFAQPNLLAGKQIIPEFLNDKVTAGVLGPALLEQLNRTDSEQLMATYSEIHRTLRQDASRTAAKAIVELLQKSQR
jgi:lipid-A-disaccharide synthase